MSNVSDVIVIGAGIIGNATAYFLTKKGLKVTVLEKSEYIGNGGSSRNGGGVRQSGRHPAELPLVMYGVKNYWPTLSEELGTDVEYYQEGNLRLGKTPEHIKTLEGLTNSAAAGGLDVRMIDYDEARAICPYLSDEVIGASWCPTDGHANPLLATLAYYRAARRNGARFISGAEVVEIKKVAGRARKVVTTDGVYEADAIVLTAGLESNRILESVGLRVPMNPALLECLVTEDSPPLFYQMLGTAMADFYGHQSKHGSFVFGGTTGFEPYTTLGKTPPATSSSAPGTCRGIIKYFPILKDLKIVRTWAGWMDDCMDHIPVIDAPEEVPGLVIGCGFSGHGFGISPTAAVILSQLAVGENTVLDISKFKYDRFKVRT
ncbi:MAG: FAD-binding oxidoreductase [Oscillospiraceae bacterium]|jgi:sarcosine oxidase subunit beta|nr:FAD-binding oxidoreductase [Oscillospiraceae bacterium]